MPSRAELLFQEIMSGDPLANVEKMVPDARQESEFLDFKNVSTNDRDNKATWAKALSGFANTEGGVLVWGIDARKPKGAQFDCAVELKPFQQPKLFAESLKSFHREATVDPVQGVEINAVAKDDGSGYVVCLIPEGAHKPYRDEQAKQYWQRVQDSFVVLSHSLLRSMFYPVARARLKVSISRVKSKVVNVYAMNVGRATARNVWMEYEIAENPKLTTYSSIPPYLERLHIGQSKEILRINLGEDAPTIPLHVHLALFMLDDEPHYLRLYLTPAELREAPNVILQDLESIDVSNYGIFSEQIWST